MTGSYVLEFKGLISLLDADGNKLKKFRFNHAVQQDILSHNSLYLSNTMLFVCMCVYESVYTCITYLLQKDWTDLANIFYQLCLSQ